MTLFRHVSTAFLMTTVALPGVAVAQSSAPAGKRQTREETLRSVAPMTRIDNRLETRIAARLRTRIENGTAMPTDPLTPFANRVRTAQPGTSQRGS